MLIFRRAFFLTFTLALILGTAIAYFASRPRADFNETYRKLSTPKLILFLDRANQIPIQSVSRLHGVASTWVYYDPGEERSDYSRSRRQFRLRPNAAVQFRSDRLDTELTLLRTGLAKLWGPRIEKDKHGETHYIFVSDALYQQDKEWHDHPRRLFTRYLMVACLISILGAATMSAAVTGIALLMRGKS